MSIYRQFERHQDFKKGEAPPKKLDAANERHYEQGRYLHPTKGWRRISIKRGRAQMLMAEQRAGKFPYPHWSLIPVLATMRKFITTGLWK